MIEFRRSAYRRIYFRRRGFIPIAEAEKQFEKQGKKFNIITQNVDGLILFILFIYFIYFKIKFVK